MADLRSPMAGDSPRWVRDRHVTRTVLQWKGLLREREWKKWGAERMKPASGIRSSRRHLGKLTFIAFVTVEN